MISIQLNKKQEKNLLKMCNKLFSEEGKWFEILDGDIYYSNNGRFPGKSIHWFEFCINNLCREIALKNTEKDFGFDPWDFDLKHKKYLKKMLMFDNPKHPVDYLYKEFKKIKLC